MVYGPARPSSWMLSSHSHTDSTCTPAYVSIRQHLYASIRQHTSSYAALAYVSIRQHLYASIRQHTSSHAAAYVSIPQQWPSRAPLACFHHIRTLPPPVPIFSHLRPAHCVCVCVCVLCVCVVCVCVCVCRAVYCSCHYTAVN